MDLEKLVIFDCDGTLVDSEEVATEVFTSYWASHGVQLTHDEFKENFIGKGNEHPEIKNFFKKMPKATAEEGDLLWKNALKEKLQVVSGMQDIISSVSSKLCVGSNSSLAHVNFSLKKTNLAKYFGNNIFSAEQVENAKPEPDLFLYACKKMNVSIENSIVIEDSPSGVMAAKNASIPVIGFTGAAHFTPVLVERLSAVGPTWLCETSDELGLLLRKLQFTRA